MDDAQGQLAAYALRAERSAGRMYLEPTDPFRGPFELDRHRIIESTAFRRLEHKTQVFAPTVHDHFRTRLTHTLEAAQVARCLAVALRANEALTEAITLAHDLGHPPFGHAGESALAALMTDHGGFNHNAHTLRVVEFLEHPYPAFRGLNLTCETLDGLRRHATGFDVPADASNDAAPSVEAQIASLADRIAYNCHDLEDAVGAEFLTAADLRDLAIWRTVWDSVVRGPTNPPLHAVRRPVLDAMLNRLIQDAVVTSLPPLAASPAIPRVLLSGQANAELEALEGLLLRRVYRRAEIADTDAQGQTLIRSLFEAYRQRPAELPPRFAARIDEQGPQRVICDFIAGMTDRFCRSECERLGCGSS